MPFRFFSSRVGRLLWICAGALWVALLSSGFSILWSYENTPGVSAAAPPAWPDDSHLPRPRARPTLVLSLHPQCTCSRATVAELARLIARAHDTVDTYVLVLSPQAMDETWWRSDLWRAASAIPGVHVARDDDGREARHFGVATSGDAVLYDAAGRLQFRGGITASRGHEGDNVGRDSLESLLLFGDSERSSTAVFGCPLFAHAEPIARDAVAR